MDAGTCLLLAALMMGGQASDYGPAAREFPSGDKYSNWCWDNPAPTEWNHVYFARRGGRWVRAATVHAHGESAACWYGNMTDLPYGLIFLTVSAQNNLESELREVPH